MLEGRSCLVSKWPYMTYSLEGESSNGKRFLTFDLNEDAEGCARKFMRMSDSNESDEADIGGWSNPIGRDLTISCLLRCPRINYCSIASLNQSFRDLVRSGEIYRLRKQNDLIEHWVYFSCRLLEWVALDPINCQWMNLPRMNASDVFMCSDKESLGVGTELLVFGKDLLSQVVYRYSILTNSWTMGGSMNVPRCLFGSASVGGIAILAGGCSSMGKILSVAELYDSEKGTWVNLPNMNTPRKMCSGVFMDDKFYVIGGTGEPNRRILSCGEEFDLKTGIWTEIPNMSPVKVADGANGLRIPSGSVAPPLVAVVNNQLYAADHTDMELKKFDKKKHTWVTIGKLPDYAGSMNGWGLAFRACGDRLIVIGGPSDRSDGTIVEVNSWVPDDGPPQWDLLATKLSGSFVYNCAVMGC